MNPTIANLKKALETGGCCRAAHIRSAPVTERLGYRVVWEGVVEVFDLQGHPEANRAFGWQYWQGDHPQYQTILGIAPVDSAESAVRSVIAQEAGQA